VHNGELFYEVSGEGPAVLLVHAGVADHTQWEPQMEALSRSYRVIRYDTRGFGRSRSQQTEFSNRQDIYDLLTHLGVDRAVLMGNSRGGIIATDFTLEHPEMVHGLVWVCGGISGYEAQATDAETDWFNNMEALWEAKDWDTLTDLEVQTWVNGIGQPEDRAPAELRTKIRDLIYANNTREEPEITPMPLDPPAAGRLSEIKCPVLVIIGDLDTSTTQAAADYLAAGVPNARKVVFRNVAHLPNLEQPEEFTAAVLDFLEEVAPGARS
jgi:3-oxoadipate enol-lactonase